MGRNARKATRRPRLCGGGAELLYGESSLTIGLWCLNHKFRLSCECQQIQIATHKDIGPATLGKVQERLISGIAAEDFAYPNGFDKLTKWKVVAEELDSV